jgi:hypothetical protein
MSADKTPLDAALGYAAQGWPVFPCSSRKIPVIKNWGSGATTNPVTITDWWGSQVPHALIGMPTGKRTGLAVLDIDRKNGKDGLRSLAELGYAQLPRTPTVLTAHGGFHLHFELPAGGLRNTVGAHGRGIGDGLDWRGDGGFVILPSPGSGYVWAEWNYDNSTCLPVPADLLPAETNAYTKHSGRLASIGPTVSGHAGVERCLRAASEGERNRLLFWAACRFGDAIACKLIGEEDAREILAKAAAHTGLADREIGRTISSAFQRAAQ